MKQVCFSLAFLLAASLQMQAQRHEIFSQRIATLQVVAGTDWLSMPISQLGGKAINIDFDDLTHDYHRYSYRIEHCDADWNVSDGLFETDYLEGFNGELTIDDVEQSVNTNQLYTHYHLAIPNENCQLTMSGNYKLTVYDENAEEDDKRVLTACFMLVEPLVKMGMAVSAATDVDSYKEHQQVKWSVKYTDIRITRPEQIKTVVLQNRRWDNAVINARPDYVSDGGMEWQHVGKLIFPAGNEYRKFEFLDVDHPTMGIDEIQWDGKEYHVSVVPDFPRPHYLNDEVAQGCFCIRNSNNIANCSESDYAQVHFTLQAPPQQGEVYLCGDWTYNRFLPSYRMSYNAARQAYEASLPLKQGYYSYKYLLQKPDGTTTEVSTEGNFYQTKNTYQALVYYRGTNDRADRLVGYKEVP